MCIYAFINELSHYSKQTLNSPGLNAFHTFNFIDRDPSYRQQTQLFIILPYYSPNKNTKKYYTSSQAHKFTYTFMFFNKNVCKYLFQMYNQTEL